MKSFLSHIVLILSHIVLILSHNVLILSQHSSTGAASRHFPSHSTLVTTRDIRKRLRAGHRSGGSRSFETSGQQLQ